MARIQCCEVQSTRKRKGLRGLQGERDHRRDSQDVQYTRQRPPRRPQLREKDCDGRGEQQKHGAGADPVLRRLDPGGKEPAIDPVVLVGNRSGKNVRQEDEHAADSQRENPIHRSRANAGCAADPRAVEGERAEMLRSEMMRHEDVVEDRERHESLLAGPRQRGVRWQEDSEASTGHQQRDGDESHRLRP